MTRTEQLLAALASCVSELKTTGITSPSEATGYFAKHAKASTERFMVLTLDGNHHPIKMRTVTTGLVNRTVVHPREVFRPAIADNAVAVIVAHNHPSGNLEPSPEDLEITQRLKEAGEIVGISVLDHLIVSRRGYVSLVERGEF